MATGFLWHELYAWHDLGSGAGPLRAGGWLQPGEEHAEHAETKRRIRNLLEVSGLLDRLVPVKPREATDEELLRFHTRGHLDKVRSADAKGGDLGLDAYVPPGSERIARLASGGAIEAVDAVIRGDIDNCYVLVRPPGHHAEPGEGLGFCIFNSIAVAAVHARAVHGRQRIAILDWDVHHGNGAQNAFYSDPDTLTISLHQDQVFPPGSGKVDDIGEGDGRGANINVPLPPGSGDGAYRDAFARVVAPALRRFDPDLILVACGFDAGGFDPMSRMLLHSDSFRHFTRVVMEIAAECCEGKLVLVHEGGYHTGLVPFLALATIEELSGETTSVVDPYLIPLTHMGGQDLQPHQRDAIDRAITSAGLGDAA